MKHKMDILVILFSICLLLCLPGVVFCQTSTINGTILFNRGPLGVFPLNQGLVELLMPDGKTVSKMTYTNPTGLFVFNNIAPGNYKLRITHAGQVLKQIINGQDKGTTSDVTVQQNQNLLLNITVKK